MRMLIPFPILLMYRTNWTTCSTLPLYVSVFPGLFFFFSPTYAPYAAEFFFAVLSSVTQAEPYAAQMFRNDRSAILSAITIRRNTYAAHTFRNVGTLPRSPCMPHAGCMLAKCVSYWQDVRARSTLTDTFFYPASVLVLVWSPQVSWF